MIRVAALLLLLCGFARAQLSPFAPPGKMVDVGGYRVHLYCTGAGNPTVMIVGAALSADWALVQPEVAKFTRVCTFDPSGVAWSDPTHGSSCLDRVDEIHRLLVNARIELPVILVGYSLGGIRARLYADEYPREVSGMVIVDHAIQFGGMGIKRPQRPSLNSPPELISLTPFAAGLEDDPAFQKLPAREQAVHRWAAPEAAARLTNEIIDGCFAKSDTLQNDLGAMPLVVVSTALSAPDYLALQRRLLSFSFNSRQMIAAKSGHGVILDEPEVVIRAIRSAVDSVRR